MKKFSTLFLAAAIFQTPAWSSGEFISCLDPSKSGFIVDIYHCTNEDACLEPYSDYHVYPVEHGRKIADFIHDFVARPISEGATLRLVDLDTLDRSSEETTVVFIENLRSGSELGSLQVKGKMLFSRLPCRHL